MKLRWIIPPLLACVSLSTAGEAPAPPADEPEDLFSVGRQLFEQLAPPEIREQFEFPSREQWDAFAARLEKAGESESLAELASYGPEARAALVALRAISGYEDFADWLEQKIDEIEAAQQALVPEKAPSPPAPKPVAPALPHYDLWLARVRDRPAPARAAEFMPRLRRAFEAEGVPPEIAWLAEAESSFNPSARSPAGAKGLFQFMPETARSLGLDTFLPDERTHPDKSARAAARYLRELHGKFGNWPLAFSAYNAGEGRLRRALTKTGAKGFSGVAPALPAETRMYVPKVCALIATRAGVPPDKIPPPQPPR